MCFEFAVVGFMVQGFGFMAQAFGFGFRAHGVWCGVQGVGFRVRGLGFEVQGLRFQIWGVKVSGIPCASPLAGGVREPPSARSRTAVGVCVRK